MSNGCSSMSKMNREPPKNVYSNNRLRKIKPADNIIITRQRSAADQSYRQQHASTSSTFTKNSNIVDKLQSGIKVDRSLHFNKSQTKYQKHFEPNVQNKNLDFKTLNGGPNVRKGYNFPNPSRQGELGIPLSHNYVQRKLLPSNQESLQPTENKKPRKNVDYSELQSCSYGVTRDRLPSNSEKPSWVPFQDSPKKKQKDDLRIELSCANDFFQGVRSTLAETFEEILKDNPELETESLKAKEEVLKELRSYVKQQQEQAVDDDSNIEDMGDCISESGFSVCSGDSDEAKTPQLFHKATLKFRENTPSLPAAHNLKSYPTQQEFMSRFRREKISRGRLTPEERLPKGPTEPLYINRYKENPQGENEPLDTCLVMLNRVKVPYGSSQYSDYSSLYSQDNRNNPPY